MLRQTLHTIVSDSKNLLYQRNFPPNPSSSYGRRSSKGNKPHLNSMRSSRSRRQLEGLKKLRERETEKRWQAHYDLMLAQTVAFECIAYEYRALMASIIKSPPVPKQPAGPNEAITWRVDHSKTPLAPRNETAKKYAEAERLLNDVIARHPKTPWPIWHKTRSITASRCISMNGTIIRSITNVRSTSPSTDRRSFAG